MKNPVAPWSFVRHGLLLAVGASLGFVSTTRAETLHVNIDGTGDFTSVGDAIEAAADGDEIVIAPGVYDERVDGESRAVLRWDIGITLRGDATEPEATTVVGLHASFGDTPGVFVERLTFRECKRRALTIGGDLSSIRDCVFEDNGESLAGGGASFAAATVAADLRIERCTFRRNVASRGGAVYASVASLIECTFIENVAQYTGGAVYTEGDLTMTRCLVAENEAGVDGSAIFYSGNLDTGLDLEQCTFWGNSGTIGAAAISLPNRAPDSRISHCIVAESRGTYGIICAEDFEITCTNMWNNEIGDGSGFCAPEPGSGMVYADPRLCDPEGGDFYLEAGSPCLPGHHDGMDCDLIGAFGLGCGLPTHDTTWGRLKFSSVK